MSIEHFHEAAVLVKVKAFIQLVEFKILFKCKKEIVFPTLEFVFRFFKFLSPIRIKLIISLKFNVSFLILSSQ